jgi:hypothetical protein
MAQRSKADNEFWAAKPFDTETVGQRVALTTASAAATVVAGGWYAVRLSAAASAPAWFEQDGTAVLPANATEGTGFYLDAGEGAVVRMASTSFSGIMVSGTGTVLITRLDV